MSTKRVVVVSDHFRFYGGKELERGQVFGMSNMLNDEKLFGWNYVREVEKNEEVYLCKCGREFIGGVTDVATRAHLLRHAGDCAINVDGPTLKGRERKPVGLGEDPDKGERGWDKGAGGDDLPITDPYEGPRNAAGKEKPKRLSLG